MSAEANRAARLTAIGAELAAEVGPATEFGSAAETGSAAEIGSSAAAPRMPMFRHVYGDCPEQFVEVYGDPAAASATVVFVHGGYFRDRTDLTHARPLAAALARAGVLVALVEYRRRGGQPRPLDDVTAAIDSVLTELPVWDTSTQARENLIVSGHSAGGCLILAWAGHLSAPGPRIRLRPLAPVTDLFREVEAGLGDGAVLDYMGLRPEADLAAYLRHDPRSRAALIPQRVEMHTIHGDSDRTVDVGFSHVFPTPLTVLAGADHFDVIDPESPHFPTVLRLLLEPQS